MGGSTSRWFDTFDIFGTRKARAQMDAQSVEQAASIAAPTSTKAAVDETKAAQDDMKKKRVSLFATEGGVAGQELEPNQVSKRNTLLGN